MLGYYHPNLTRDKSPSETNKETSFINLMRSLILYSDALSYKFNTFFQDSRVKDIAQDMERTHYLEMNSTSPYELYALVQNLLCRFNTVITQINKIIEFVASQESGKNFFMYSDSLILKHETEENILLLLDSVKAYFGNPSKGYVDTNMFYGTGNEFLKVLNTLIDEINVGGVTWTKNQFKNNELNYGSYNCGNKTKNAIYQQQFFQSHQAIQIFSREQVRTFGNSFVLTTGKTLNI